jgi:hypothetical protein
LAAAKSTHGSRAALPRGFEVRGSLYYLEESKSIKTAIFIES